MYFLGFLQIIQHLKDYPGRLESIYDVYTSIIHSCVCIVKRQISVCILYVTWMD